MAEDYARACALPREVVVGGRVFLVSKIGPRMLGELQRWMMSVLEDPRIKARDRLRADPDMPDEEARRIWTEAAVAALDWPPELGSDLGTTLLMSAEGWARFLWLVARGNEPGLTLDLCRGAAQVMSDAEWRALWEAASPRELGDTIEPDTGGEGLPYTEVRAKLCETYGWTFEYVDGLSFEQIRMAWSGGKGAQGLPVEDAAQAAHVYEHWRDYVHGLR